VKNYTVRRYEAHDRDLWNTFIRKAKNATFLFDRDFMEYHSNRFEDCSLLVFDDATLVAVLPANRIGNQLFSHQGLTYGGLVLAEKTKLESVLDIFGQLLEYLHHEQIVSLQLKQIPFIYCDHFSHEINYALFIAQARLMRTDCLSVIDFGKPVHYSKDRKEGVKKGLKNNLDIKEETSFAAFWNDILVPNLNARHGVAPVHSLVEIEMLHARFPQNIRQFNVYDNGKIVAGTTIFISKHVAHSQYISGNADKNKSGALDLLHDHLLAGVFNDKHFFDFGISNENQGKNINQGLLYWKESFGARIVTQDFYEVETANHGLLKNVLI
jgi:hypothetical protein